MPPLSDIDRARLRQVAEERGVDAEALIAEAEAMRSEREGGGDAGGEAGAQSAKPAFDRLLIGAFPFIRVRELRSNWLGLADEEPVEDDHLTTGKWLEKHGGIHAAGASSGDDQE